MKHRYEQNPDLVMLTEHYAKALMQVLRNSLAWLRGENSAQCWHCKQWIALKRR
jgi:hypothetical protein